jgi:hypothetical protein
MLIHNPIIGLNGKIYISIFKYHFHFENDSVLIRVSSKSLYEDDWWSIDRERNLLVSRTFYRSSIENIAIQVGSQRNRMLSFWPGRTNINIGPHVGEYCSNCGKKQDYDKQKYCKSCGNELIFYSGNIEYPNDFLFPPENELNEALKNYEWIRGGFMKLIIDSYSIDINASRETINSVILELAKLDRRYFDGFISETKSPFVIRFIRTSSTRINFEIVSMEKTSVDLYLDKVDGSTLLVSNVDDSFEVQAYKAKIGERLYIRAKSRHKTISDALEFDLN